MFSTIRKWIYNASEWVAGGKQGRREHMPPPSDERDAYMHADTAASMVYTWDKRLDDMGVDDALSAHIPEAVRALGNAKEALGGLTNVDYSDADSWKDKYNNEVGILIGQYVRDHGYSEEVLHKLVREAYDSGKLIRDEQKDVRDDQFKHGELTPSWTPPTGFASIEKSR